MMTLLFDIGGTNTRASVSAGEGLGEVMHWKTPASAIEAIERLASLGPVDRAAGGIAAILEEGNIVGQPTNLQGWQAFPFGHELTSALRVPVLVRNDAELAALGEATYGAGKGYRSIAYIGIGTGVGTARIVDGVIEPHSSDGEARFSTITLSDDTTLEERVGGHALTALYGVEPKQLAREIWDSLTPLVAEGVRNAIERWSPNAIILGGSLMNEDNGFRLEDIRQSVGKTEVSIHRATLRDEAGLWGALALRLESVE